MVFLYNSRSLNIHKLKQGGLYVKRTCFGIFKIIFELEKLGKINNSKLGD
jgi:hypothetical protein